MRWQLQRAKQQFSELIREVESGEAQIVTKHGQDVAVVIDIAQYNKLCGVEMSFADFLVNDPFLDDDFEIERLPDLPRDVDLSP